MPIPGIVAGVDVGTNSLLLTMARSNSEGFQVLEERCVVTRLGEGLGQEGQLSQEAVDRTLAVLQEFGAAIMALGARARAAGTSALRRANNGDQFIKDATEALGVPLEVLSGSEEARISHRGALSELPGVDPLAPPLVVDPGGGSTEIFDQSGQATSLEIGAVRLTEGFLTQDPPTSSELEALADHVRRVVAPLEPSSPRNLVAVGGTATTLAAVSAGLEVYDANRVHGSQLSLDEIRAIGRRLATLSLAEREQIPCLPKGRADIIVAGAVLLEILLTHLGAEGMIVSDRGLRYGLIAELLTS